MGKSRGKHNPKWRRYKKRKGGGGQSGNGRGSGSCRGNGRDNGRSKIADVWLEKTLNLARIWSRKIEIGM